MSPHLSAHIPKSLFGENSQRSLRCFSNSIRPLLSQWQHNICRSYRGQKHAESSYRKYTSRFGLVTHEPSTRQHIKRDPPPLNSVKQESLEITPEKDGFKGKFKKGERGAFLRMTRKKKLKKQTKTTGSLNKKRQSKAAKVGFKPQQTEVIAEELDYYFSESEIIGFDGDTYAEARYEFIQDTNLSRLDMVFNGVTLSFDLITETMLPVSAEDEVKLQAYMQSQEFLTIQEVSLELLQNQDQFADPEFLLGFVAIAMLIDPAEDAPIDGETAKVESPNKLKLGGAIGRFMTTKLTMPNDGLPMRPCSATANSTSLTKNNSVKTANAMQQGGCFGGCGYGCYVIRDASGREIYGSPCAAHDACVRERGLLDRTCNRLFPIAAAYVFYRFIRGRPRYSD